MKYEHLFSPATLGDLNLPHRVIMAPLTRSRSKQPGDIPWELNVEYYQQRAGDAKGYTDYPTLEENKENVECNNAHFLVTKASPFQAFLERLTGITL